MLRKFSVVLVLLVLLFGATGCITLNKKTTTTTNLGGVFFTDDRFENWSHRSKLMTPSDTPGTIGDVNAYFIRFDPSDSSAIYLGTKANGLYYSYTGGNGWTKSKNLPEGFIRDLVIDSKDKCTSYAAVGSKVYRSEDCTRNWERVFMADKAGVYVSSLGHDWFDSNIVYAGLSDGSLLKSSDYGVSWKLSNKFPNRVVKIIVDPNDSRVLYAGIMNGGLYKTVDKGDKWEDLNKQMKDFSSSKIYFDFVVSKSQKNLVLYANKFGMLKSLDGGTTWSEVKLLTQPSEERIYSLDIDPSSASHVYYSTDKAIYKTLDGGENWVVKKMPTARIAGEIAVHPEKGNNIFVGVKTITQ
ncbi:hypothetical protein HQ571_04495 [Candidatus Kuenenbacteria bacterium]|nr:hypothetical protein [Candidatus Kuenenbacteria bacterium]